LFFCFSENGNRIYNGSVTFNNKELELEIEIKVDLDKDRSVCSAFATKR